MHDEEQQDEGSEGKIIYTSGDSSSDDDKNGHDIDPRWEQLKKLK